MVASIVLFGVILFFSADNAGMFFDLPSLLLVLVGTLAATFISYPLAEVIRILKLIGTIMRNERLYTQRDIDDLIQISRIWMTGNIRAVETALAKVSNPFLRTGVQLVIDHASEDDIIELMQWRISRLRAKEHAEAQLFRVMASYAPAFGMMGTLIGLVNLMFMLGDGDITAIGQHMAFALITTFYGILLANLLFKPVAVKLERRTEQRVALMNMVMQGVSMMAQKRSPAMMQETLHSFMEKFDDEILDEIIANERAKRRTSPRSETGAP